MPPAEAVDDEGVDDIATRVLEVRRGRLSDGSGHQPTLVQSTLFTVLVGVPLTSR
ncbi:hypothetical protein [Salibaculum sp.]|uniref:hypothetical protein n=1 Tax=Salibaculum sp. TaxID=2855480 RepID=UPI002B4AA7BE|nr:hypothetical protein [Salibaculum sp.]HKL70437.1 hypothetical protein [Salibaculum sp.]